MSVQLGARYQGTLDNQSSAVASQPTSIPSLCRTPTMMDLTRVIELRYQRHGALEGPRGHLTTIATTTIANATTMSALTDLLGFLPNMTNCKLS